MTPRDQQTSRTLMVAEALAGWDDADFGREMVAEQGERRRRSSSGRRASASASAPPPPSSPPPSAAPPLHPLRALVGLALRPLSGRSDDTSRPDTHASARPSTAITTPPKAEAPRRRASATAPAARRRRPTTADALASHPPAAAPSSSSSSGDEEDDPQYDRRQPYRSGLKITEAPDYVHFPFLLRGYRAGGSYGRNLRALLEWHTETLNAWTMIAGVVLSVWQLVIALKGPAGALRPPQTWREALPFVALTLSCAAHAPFSVGFHLFRGMSPRVYNLWRRLDQAFIFLASVPMAWALAAWAQGGPFDGGLLSSKQGPDDHPHWTGGPAARATFAVAALVACWATGVIASLKPGFRRDKRQMVLFVGTIVACYWAPMAATAFEDVRRWHRQQGGGAAARAAVPAHHHPAHGPALFAAALPLPSLNPTDPPSSAPTPLVLYHGLGAARAALGVLLSLLLGALVYASGWPERRWPGRFDLVGSSHQLMHVAVVSAHAFKHAFLRELWRRRCVEEALLLGGGGQAAASLGRVLSVRAALGRGVAVAVALISDGLGMAAAALEGVLRRPVPLVSGGISPATLAGVCVAAAVLLRAQRQRNEAGRRSAGLVASSSSGGGGGRGAVEVNKPSPPRASCEIVPSSASSSGCGDKLLEAVASA